MPSTDRKTSTTDRKLPGPVYAAAGAGELALERLRRLPGQITELRDEFQEKARLNERFQVVREDLREAGRKVRDFDTTRIKEAASKAQERAKETYTDLVTRGERVAKGERSPIRVTATVTDPEKDGAEPAKAAPKAAPKTARKTTPRAKKA